MPEPANTQQPPSAAHRVLKALKWILDTALYYWMIIGIGIAVLLAYLFPNVGRSEGVIRSQYSIDYGAVAFIFLVSGISTSTQTIIKMAAHWRSHLLVQVISFLITPTIIFAFAEAMRAAHNPRIDPYILVGLIITGCTPTTVSSNIVMTRQSNGNDSLALIEVTVGNVLGAFITPALVQMYLSVGTGFSYGNPALGSSVASLYGHVMKHLSLAVFLPLAVGQALRGIWPKQVQYLYTTFKLNKFGSFCLLLLIWTTFSTAFHQNAFEVVPTASIIMTVFFNIGVYLVFCIICFYMARSPLSKHALRQLPFLQAEYERAKARGEKARKPVKYYIYKLIGPFFFTRRDTIAVILCGAAKTVVLGVPLINAQYGERSDLIGRVSIPLVLYQGEQLVVSQFLIPIFKRWVAKEDLDNELFGIDDNNLSSGLSGEDDLSSQQSDKKDSVEIQETKVPVQTII